MWSCLVRESLSAREIARLEAAFAKAGLNDWEVTGNRLRVPRAQRFSYLAAANVENSLPADFDSFLEEMLKNSTPFETRELREMRRNFAMQRELAGIIDALDGVERATVKVNEERAGPFSRDIRRTALVAARATSGEFLTAMQVDAIRRTIASGTGTPPENIVVTDLRGVAHSGEIPRSGPTPYEHLFSAEKKEYEQYYQEKILRSLSMIPGVVVGVNVELARKPPYSQLMPGFDDSLPLAASRSPPRTEQAGGSSDSADDSQALGNRPKEVTASLDGEEPRDRNYHLPEFSVEVPPRQPSSPRVRQDSPLGQSPIATGSSRRGLKNAIGSMSGEAFESLDSADHTTNVTATIQVPRSYFQRILQSREGIQGAQAAPASEDELLRFERQEFERIEATVRNLLPRSADEQPEQARVVVRTFADNANGPGASTTLAHRTIDWFVEHRAAWISLACGILGLVIVPSLLLAIRSSWRPEEPVPTQGKSGSFRYHSPPCSPPDHDSPHPAVTEDSHIDIADHDDLDSSSRDLRKKLLELVRDEPDVAACVLSQWIEDAA
jgi:flagellar biosynthesis/type III secretory pathway M-ring protein FliF/YscJ